MFADYFSAKVIKVPGRLYPISLEYIPTEFDADGRPSAPTVQARRPSLSRASLCKATRYLPRRDVSDWYGVRDAACPLSTRRGGGGGGGFCPVATGPRGPGSWDVHPAGGV